MDISAQKQQYQALQTARTELVESAVNEIASHLDGLDPDVCGEILSKLRLKLTGKGKSEPSRLKGAATSHSSLENERPMLESFPNKRERPPSWPCRPTSLLNNTTEG